MQEQGSSCSGSLMKGTQAVGLGCSLWKLTKAENSTSGLTTILLLPAVYFSSLP